MRREGTGLDSCEKCWHFLRGKGVKVSLRVLLATRFFLFNAPRKHLTRFPEHPLLNRRRCPMGSAAECPVVRERQDSNRWKSGNVGKAKHLKCIIKNNMRKGEF